jgi:hypothetical protein
MNSERRMVVLRAGIVPPAQVKELSRWAGGEVPTEVKVETDRRQALVDIREVIEGQETVEIRQTDLDAIKFYEANQLPARLYYSVPAGEGKRKTTFANVHYAKNAIGNYMIPWTDEDIYDLMLDEGTYLKPDGEARVYFSNISELYYGTKKMFMICMPAPIAEPT